MRQVPVDQVIDSLVSVVITYCSREDLNLEDIYHSKIDRAGRDKNADRSSK